MIPMTDTMEVPEHLKQALDGPGRGNENITQEDVSVPRLVLIQEKTTCLKEGNDSYIEGSCPGMMYNSLTKELYTVLNICFVAFEIEYIPKQLKKNQSEFIGRYKTLEEAEKAILEAENSSSFTAVRTPQHYGLILKDDGSFEPIVIAMARGKSGAHKEINNLVRQGDRFAYVLELQATLYTSKDGNENFTYKVKKAGFASKELYAKGLELYKLHTQGKTSINVEDVENVETTNEEY